MKISIWLIMTCIVMTLATCDEVPKTKRDLVLVKKLIAAAIHGGKLENSSTVPRAIITAPTENIDQIPGYTRVPVKVVPEQINTARNCITVLVKEDSRVNPINAHIRSSLAAKSISKPLKAVKNYLHSGVTDVKRGTIVDRVQIPIVPPPLRYIQSFHNYEVPLHNILLDPITLYPQLIPVIEENTSLIFPPPICNLPNSCVPSPVKPQIPPAAFPPEPVPQFIYPRNPLEVLIAPVAPVPPFQPQYSYKQIKGDGSITTYEVNSKGEVLVSETPKVTSSPPQYVFDRFKQLSSNLPLSPTKATYVLNELPTTTSHISIDKVIVPSALSLPQKSNEAKLQLNHNNPENVSVNINQTPSHIEDVVIKRNNYSNEHNPLADQKKNQTESNKVDFVLKPSTGAQNAVVSILSDENFSESKPIVVPDAPSFLYNQHNPDSSSLIVRGINDTVSVQIDESTTKENDIQNYRGDIP